jgi:D-proline reductase (dithiol) PrdB
MKYLKYVDVVRSMFPDQPPYQWTENASVPWTPMVKPLAESRLALISSSGTYRRGQTPFKPDKNDLTFREIAVETDAGDLLISHDYYDHRDAEEDINCVFPLERLRELASEGFIGGLTAFHLTFMGRIFRKTQFLDEMIPAMIARLKAMETDLVLLVPA